MIRLPAILTRFSRRADRTCNLTFETQEVSSQELKEFDEHYQKFGWLLFDENEITTSDIPKERADENKDKTPSKRLRAVLYVLSQQRGIAKEKFEEFYREQVEKIIEHIKTKLDD